MKFRDLMHRVEADGWRLAHQVGSHRQYKHQTKPGRVTIAGKPGLDVPVGTLKAILKQAGIEPEGKR